MNAFRNAALACLLVIALRVSAADTLIPTVTAAELAANALTNPVTMQIISNLTTEIGPRLDGSEAEKRAAAWAIQTCQQLGFDKVWHEQFTLTNGWVRGLERAEIVTPSPQPLIITALGGSVATPPEGIEAEIVLFKSYSELLAAPTNSLKGKIAVVTESMVRSQDGSGYGLANKIRTKGASEAAWRGAIAYLCRSLGTDHHRVPHTGNLHYLTNTARIPAAALSMPDADQLERLAAKGAPIHVKLVLTPRELGPVTSQNVIAEIAGTEETNQVVVLGAHLDSWDLGTGAIDDGAGVAVVLGAAKLIHDLPHHPKRTIRIILFGSEETGLHGGHAYIQAHQSELTNIVIAAESDLGQGPVFRFRTGVTNAEEPTLTNIRKSLAPLKISFGDNSSNGDSETELFFDSQVPVVSLDPDATEYFDLHHTADDTLDKIIPSRLNQSTAAYAVFAYLVAELDGNYRLPSPPSR